MIIAIWFWLTSEDQMLAFLQPTQIRCQIDNRFTLMDHKLWWDNFTEIFLMTKVHTRENFIKILTKMGGHDWGKSFTVTISKLMTENSTNIYWHIIFFQVYLENTTGKLVLSVKKAITVVFCCVAAIFKLQNSLAPFDLFSRIVFINSFSAFVASDWLTKLELHFKNSKVSHCFHIFKALIILIRIFHWNLDLWMQKYSLVNLTVVVCPTTDATIVNMVLSFMIRTDWWFWL